MYDFFKNFLRIKKSYIKKKMKLEEVVDQLKKEIKGSNQADVIEDLQNILIKNVEELSKTEEFFNLPLTNIFSVISKVDFSSIDNNDDIKIIIKDIIQKTVNKHFEEKETLMILQNIEITNLYLSYEDILSFLDFSSASS